MTADTMTLTPTEQAWLTQCGPIASSNHLVEWLDATTLHPHDQVFVELEADGVALDGVFTPTQLMALVGLMALRQPTAFPSHFVNALNAGRDPSAG